MNPSQEIGSSFLDVCKWQVIDFNQKFSLGWDGSSVGTGLRETQQFIQSLYEEVGYSVF